MAHYTPMLPALIRSKATMGGLAEAHTSSGNIASWHMYVREKASIQ